MSSTTTAEAYNIAVPVFGILTTVTTIILGIVMTVYYAKKSNMLQGQYMSKGENTRADLVSKRNYYHYKVFTSVFTLSLLRFVYWIMCISYKTSNNIVLHSVSIFCAFFYYWIQSAISQ